MSVPEKHQLCLWNSCKGVSTFIGNGKEGNVDGKSADCELFQPTGICVEFDHVVYFCDSRTSTIKVASTMKETARFLQSINYLMNAFSIHEKKGALFYNYYN